MGLLSPVTIGYDDDVTDAAILDALVTVEVALVRAYGALGVAPTSVVTAVDHAFADGHGIDHAAVAAASVAGGNPVIPLVGQLLDRVPAEARVWLHRGATSQDILDSALMLVGRAAADRILASLVEIEGALTVFAAAHRDDVAAARTLTQHAVPTTVGLRATTWLRGIRRASERLDAAARALPAQLGGAAGTLASFVEIAGAEAAAALPAAFARELGLAAPDAPWHTTRWPITEFGDALVQVVDAVAVIAADVATLSRTEIGEVVEGLGGGSSAMPQKHNPAASVLIRSAALRAPQLGATLHVAAALAVDERPDGAWHAEWPTLTELLSLARGAAAHGAALARGLQVDGDAVARNLARTRGLIVAERLSIVLGPVIGREAAAGLVAAAAGGADLVALVTAAIETAAEGTAAREDAGTTTIDVAALVDPARYTGLAARLVDQATGTAPARKEAP